MNSSGITYSLCLLRAPIINSETKEVSQRKCACFIGKQRDTYSPVIKELGFNKIALKGFSLDLISMIYMFSRKKKFAKIGPWKTT